MDRELYDKLLEWKSKDGRKPLVLNGARQVGKTWLLSEFGRREYSKVVSFSLDRNLEARKVFLEKGLVSDILRKLSALAMTDITPGDTLVIIDEIQDCPSALECLKFFCEDAPASAVLVGNGIFSEYKGAFTELYVCTQLECAGVPVFYHTVEGSRVEIDFVVQVGAKVYPVEVKAEENLQSKSLKTFVGGHPELKGMRLSMKPYVDQGWMENVPLYAFAELLRRRMTAEGK